MARLHAVVPRAEVLGVSRTSCAGLHGDVVATDLTDAPATAALLDEVRPTHIVHLASIASPARAEVERGLARALDVELTRHLAGWTAGAGSWMLLTSTDYVWSGEDAGRRDEDHRPRPRTHYGRCKVAAERAVIAQRAGTVLRCPLLVGAAACSRRTTTWHALGRRMVAGQEITAPEGERRTPARLVDAARAIVDLGRLRHRGVLHLAGPEELTTLRLLRRLARALDVDAAIGEGALALPGGRERPKHLAMEGARLHELLGWQPQPVDRDTLRAAAMVPARQAVAT